MNKIVLFSASRVCPGPIEYAIMPNRMPFYYDSVNPTERIEFDRRVCKTFQIRRALKVQPQDAYTIEERFRSDFGEHGNVEIQPDANGVVVFGSINVAFDSPIIEQWLTETQEKMNRTAERNIMIEASLRERNVILDQLRKHWYGRLALWMSGRKK